MSVIERLVAIVSAPAPAPQATPRDDLELVTDTALSLLSNERRRLTIRFVAEEVDDVFDLVDLTHYVATEQYGRDYTNSERKAVYVSLYQTHLPELVDAGALERIDDDHDSHTFRAGEPVRPLFDVLEATTARFGGDA